MLRIVAERGKYFYNYSEYWFAGAQRFFCSCCCKNKPWYQRNIEKLERHDAASEKLSEEIDIIKFIYVLRVGQFLSKLILNKSQRALVTSFKKYQIDDLGLANKTKGTIPGEQSDALLVPGIQEEDGLNEVMDAVGSVEHLTSGQKELLKTIVENFSPEDSAADLSILYETTGFQAESENFQFWENYKDFEELGQTKLVRQDKNEEIIATRRNTDQKKINFEDEGSDDDVR